MVEPYTHKRIRKTPNPQVGDYKKERDTLQALW